mgnify:CR=1 FL=1
MGIGGLQAGNPPVEHRESEHEGRRARKRVHPLNAGTCAPKGHKPIAQGIALGAYWVFTCALLRAKA